MQFLSIAARELRVAARKRGTYWLRLVAAVVALFLSGFALWFVTLFGAKPLSGEELFFTLSWAAFFCACLAGPALTADCVSEERNQGTLGLLFLTHVKGVSISLGKLAGRGLVAIYAMVAILPVMALPLFLGGTDLESLGKTALVLFVTVLLSLTAGMFASTVCRNGWRAAAMALAFLVGLVAGIPMITSILRMSQLGYWAVGLEWLSPSYSLSMASPSAAAMPGHRLWLALGAQVFLGLSLFGWVTFLLPRLWKEGTKKSQKIQLAWRTLKFGSGEASRGLRTRLLRRNPIIWLSARERFGPAGFALVLVALAGVISWAGQFVSLRFDEFLRPMVAWIVGLPLLYICFCFRLAVAASERFAVDRKAGALELILCTPLKTREIIRGHWLGLIRRFWGSALVLLALHAFALNYIVEAIRIEGSLRGFGWWAALVRPLKHLARVEAIPNEVAPFYIACLAVLTAAILIVILWIALGWLGMALSLKLRREFFAPWAALLLLAVPPVPIFIAVLPLFDHQRFQSDLFRQMLLVGATGFFIVLANAFLWLFLARRWMLRNLRGRTGLSGA